ncbi:hypothetical protein DFJ74DRAFT_683168 [Hyaloraphidium curvatum]|nr:hypothetical protein DFJ74DRAFT_683168 [Hyaloraphidium curvatum]
MESGKLGGVVADRPTILIATDFSKHSEDAVTWAVDNMILSGDRLLLYHVIPENASPAGRTPIAEDDVGLMFDDATPGKASQIHEARDAMNGLMARVTAAVGNMEDVAVEGLIEFGSSGEALVQKAKAIRPRFIVVGTRGSQSTWRGLVMGSTSSYVLTHCDIPVIISRGPKPGRRGSIFGPQGGTSGSGQSPGGVTTSGGLLAAPKE